MSAQVITRRLTLSDLQKLYKNGEKITMLTCYDAGFASLLDACMVDILLIGDSLGMVVQGHDSTLPVSLDDIIYHTNAVKRGSQRAFIIADMPWGTSQVSPQQTFIHAANLLAAGAQMVKIEGGSEMIETVAFLSSRGIPVCAHIGLTPQSVNQFGGYKVQGKDNDSAQRIKNEANSLAQAGAAMLLIEAIPAALASEISQNIAIPTIGIGAGNGTSGQVLVLYDMLNIIPGKKPRFVKDFMNGKSDIASAIKDYIVSVKDLSFPADEHCY